LDPARRVRRCFVGHGAFGSITKKAWVPYFGVWGIPELWAWRLMPVVGVVDIAIGVLVLFAPVRAVFFWGLQTAALRPLAGEPAAAIAWILRGTAAMLLIGHGAFGFAMRKPEWTGYVGSLGIAAATGDGWLLTPLIGWFECVGVIVLAAPCRQCSSSPSPGRWARSSCARSLASPPGSASSERGAMPLCSPCWCFQPLRGWASLARA
jgi:hypothetical protein